MRRYVVFKAPQVVPESQETEPEEKDGKTIDSNVTPV